MDQKYVLDGKEPKPVGLMEWARWFETADRTVARDNIGDDVTVSTVFLSLNHRIGDGPPLIFETMIFGGDQDGYQDRCSTWEQAEEMHRKAVTLATES